MAKDRELQDHERAHTGKAGAKVRHGADAVGDVFWTPERRANFKQRISEARAMAKPSEPPKLRPII